MSLLGQAKDIYKMRAQAKKLQKALSEELIEVEADSGKIVITISADQKIKKLTISPEAMTSADALGANIVKAFNKAIETAQKIAAEKMQSLGGFPGLT